MRVAASQQVTGFSLPSLRDPGRLVDARGIPALGVVLLVVAVSFAGGAVDVLTGEGLRTLFAICFVGSCAAAPLLVRRRELLPIVVMPPLAYAFVALAAGAIDISGMAGSFLTQEALELVTELVTGAPVLLLGTLAAVAAAVTRGVLGKRRVSR